MNLSPSLPLIICDHCLSRVRALRYPSSSGFPQGKLLHGAVLFLTYSRIWFGVPSPVRATLLPLP